MLWVKKHPPAGRASGVPRHGDLRNQQDAALLEAWHDSCLLVRALDEACKGGSRRESVVSEALYTAHEWDLAREILRYLETHPAAKDTVDGMAQWWLQGVGGAHGRRDVERAVALLCSHDLILETRRTGLPPYYQRNPPQREAIARSLNGSHSRTHG